MSVLKEFRDFAAKGNVVDLAVGVIIGAAFGKIVTSFTEDILMPPLGTILGKVDFSNLFLPLTPDKITAGMNLAEAKKAGAVIAYGNFLNQIINFLIVAFAMFLVVKAMNRFREVLDAAPAPPTPSETLLTEIRDLLKVQAGHQTTPGS